MKSHLRSDVILHFESEHHLVAPIICGVKGEPWSDAFMQSLKDKAMAKFGKDCMRVAYMMEIVVTYMEKDWDWMD